MARVFLDANFFIDLVEQRKPVNVSQFEEQGLFISPLSIHILVYVYRYSLPNKDLANLADYFNLVPFDQDITYKALTGPTVDFEDNIQLHSASSAECDLFLTRDQSLLRLGFFGKTQITQYLTKTD